MLDFRSDTVTRPTPGMRAAMAAAEVGDDVFSEDPTVNALQERIADLLGKEAAIFVPSGSMSNQLAVRIHCRPGDELLCEAGCHIQNYEQSAHVQLSGVAAMPVEGQYGVLDVTQLRGRIRPDNEHCARTRLVCLENTHNRGAGRIQPYENVVDICAWAREHDLATHLDGARLMNAVVATGIPAAVWAQHFDTVSICFSKGLGAPIGSALVGERDAIRAARRHRKALGGAMRQVGIIAAGALYALDHHIQRLDDDHIHARRLGEAIRGISGLTLAPPDVHTNIVIFEVAPELGSAAYFCGRLGLQGLHMLAISPTRVRAVTHLDITADDVERACQILADVASSTAESGSEIPVGQAY